MSNCDDRNPNEREPAEEHQEQMQSTPEELDESRQQREAELMIQMCNDHVKRNSFFLWMIGFINNFHYCLVTSAANALAEGYGFKRLIALISWCNVFFGIFVRIIAVCIATHVSYNTRILITTMVGLIGVLLMSFASDIGGHNNTAAFVIMLIGVTLVGIESSYGESSVLAYVQRYPADTVGAWSSGTGISGVASTLIYIGLQAAGLSKEHIFLVSIPFFLIYWLSFEVGMLAPHKVATVTKPNGSVKRHAIPWGREEEFIDKLRLKSEAKGEIVSEDYTIEMLTNIVALSWRNFPHAVKQDEDIDDELDENGELKDDLYFPVCRIVCGHCSRDNGFRAWWRHNAHILIVMHNNWLYLYFNLTIVYIFEYAAQFMAPFSFYCTKAWPYNFWIINSYLISQLCYQFGVLISRSSLLYLKISAVGILSLIQLVNAIGWLIQAKTLFISTKSNFHEQVRLCFLLFAWMIFVGLMGGASYVNVFYLILCRCDKRERDQAKDAVAEYLAQARAQEREGKNEDEANHVIEDIAQKVEIGSHSGDEDSDSLVPRTQEEMDEVNEIRTKLHAIWQERREMGMNIGALYASIGITLGTVLDLIFTNTLHLDSGECTFNEKKSITNLNQK